MRARRRGGERERGGGRGIERDRKGEASVKSKSGSPVRRAAQLLRLGLEVERARVVQVHPSVLRRHRERFAVARVSDSAQPVLRIARLVQHLFREVNGCAFSGGGGATVR